MWNSSAFITDKGQPRLPNTSYSASITRAGEAGAAGTVAAVQRFFRSHVQQTAAHFYLHKNTLQYRLGRIRARCGLDPRAFRDGCVLYTALCLERIRAAGPKPPAPAEAPLQPK